jgi:hypothetical protein
MSSFYGPAAGYTHRQTVAADTWNIAHNMNVKPTVQVYVIRANNEYERIMPKEIQIVDDNHVKILFSVPMIGKVILI